MYCLIKRENHPDRCIEEVLGPFDTDEAATAEAAEQRKADLRYYGPEGRRYTYDVWQLNTP